LQWACAVIGVYVVFAAVIGTSWVISNLWLGSVSCFSSAASCGPVTIGSYPPWFEVALFPFGAAMGAIQSIASALAFAKSVWSLSIVIMLAGTLTGLIGILLVWYGRRSNRPPAAAREREYWTGTKAPAKESVR
jgi:uncharacterized membrane protein